MKNKLYHICIAVIFVGLLVLLTDPFMIWMPQSVQMTALLFVTILAVLWAGFVVYEKTNDERELVHKLKAGRVAYLSGLAMLTLALIVQGLSHSIDVWITITLGVMVISKLTTRLYSETYQ